MSGALSISLHRQQPDKPQHPAVIMRGAGGGRVQSLRDRRIACRSDRPCQPCRVEDAQDPKCRSGLAERPGSYPDRISLADSPPVGFRATPGAHQPADESRNRSRRPATVVRTVACPQDGSPPSEVILTGERLRRRSTDRGSHIASKKRFLAPGFYAERGGGTSNATAHKCIGRYSSPPRLGLAPGMTHGMDGHKASLTYG